MNTKSPNTNKVRLLYIGGFSRCGSTILSNILGEVEGFFNAGELMYIWDRMVSEDGICGCGSHVNNCEVWSKVLDEAFGPDRQVDCKKMIELRNSEWQSRKIPFWLSLRHSREKLTSNLKVYLSNLSKLYSTFGSKIPERVIIDSSKNPAYLYMLSTLAELDLYVVHIVRDSRANAYSWLSKKEGFTQVSSWRSAVSWNGRNLMLDLLGRQLGERYMRLKYEDLVVDPGRAVNSIVDLVGEEQKPWPFINNDEVDLGENHCVYGNPDLFKTGKTKLRLDERWKAMRKRDKIITSALTWPLMSRFGY